MPDRRGASGDFVSQRACLHRPAALGHRRHRLSRPIGARLPGRPARLRERPARWRGCRQGCG
eukprot:14976683-Alexandrium_andersonii.AAC.1